MSRLLKTLVVALQGDGLTMGGLMVIKRGGEPSFAYAEERFGDHADFDEVLKACQAASDKGSNLPPASK